MSFYPVYDPHLSALEWFGPQATPASFFDVTYAETTGSTIVSAAGKADGASSANANGASFDASAGTANGLSTASATGASQNAFAGVADGASAASATGSAQAASAGTANGTSTSSGLAASIATAAGEADGTSAASAICAAQFASSGTVNGATTALAVGTSLAIAAGAADGTSAALAAGLSTVAVYGASDGTSTANAVGSSASVISATGVANGAASASAVGAAATIVVILGAGPDETWSPWLGKTGHRGILQKILPPLEVPKAAKAPEEKRPEPDYFDQMADRILAQYTTAKNQPIDLQGAILRAENAISAKRQSDDWVKKREVEGYIERVRRDGERRQRAFEDAAFREQQIALQKQERLHAEAAKRAIEIKRRIERDNEDIVFMLTGIM